MPFNVEKNAPFKITQAYIDVMGGTESACYLKYITNCVTGFLAVRERADELVEMVISMQTGVTLSCLDGGSDTIEALRGRFKLELDNKGAVNHMLQLTQDAQHSFSTK